jgi:orotidine-5'-phosphate decarboxylase
VLKNPILVALDVDQPEKALEIAQELKGIVGGFKVGPRLVMKQGSQLVQKLSGLGPVFVDMKHFDIPSTMTSAIQTSFDSGASLVTVHGMSGLEALTACAQLENRLNQIRPFKILSVSVLTSWNEKSFPESFKSQSISQHVLDLVSLTKKSGLSGIVCSGHELDLFLNDALFKVVPGIRMSQDSTDDQKRILGPQDAIAKKASALVVGRPIVEAKDLKKAALGFVEATS